LTQAELGHAVGLDRTAIAKVETGVRKVSAAELLAIASVLDRPIDSFVFEPPPSVVSRRSDALAGSRSRLPDMRIDRLVLQQRLVISDSTGIVTFPGGGLAVAPPA
jgi:transcriptional regulator with XRE-family HTH domain